MLAKAEIWAGLFWLAIRLLDGDARVEEADGQRGDDRIGRRRGTASEDECDTGEGCGHANRAEVGTAE